MTNIDDSLALTVPTSEFFETVSTDDMPILTGLDPPMTWHTLNSFLPIFEKLAPKFVLDQNAYHIHGLFDDNDLEFLRSYTSLVTEFILTDDKPIIDPSTFLRIAQVLEPNSGLLPSLLRLRIIQADTYFLCLHLLHTSSLRTLEANVPDHRHPNFFSFLTTLVHRAPLLEEIILGPGQFPLKSLQEILKFTRLRHLELRDVASTIDFTFLQDVGTLLNLESFILDARSCTYTARIPEEQPSNKAPTEELTEVGSQMLQPSSNVEDNTGVGREAPKPSSDIDGNGPSPIAYPFLSRPSTPKIGVNDKVDQPPPPIFNEIPFNNDSSILAGGGFCQLKRLYFVGGLSLLQDLIMYIASSTLEDISITVNHRSPQDLKQELEAESMRKAKRRQELDQDILAMEKVHKKVSSSSRSSKRQAIIEKAETRWKEQEGKEAEKEKVQKLQKHTTILQTVSSRWSADLKTVKFNNSDGSPQPLLTLPVLSKLVYGPLFCHPNLEILELKQWKIDSIEDLLFSMKSSDSKKLKQLRLPLDDPDSAISLSGLLDIAEACPMLESLHCCIDTRSPIPEYSIRTTKDLSHGLQSLFVANNPTSLWDFNQLLLVARHLHHIFPRLQTIDSVGPNSEQWVRICDLVKMFQVIREEAFINLLQQ